MLGWAAVLTAMLVVSACGSSSDSFVRNLALDWDQPGSFTDFGQYNGEADYMDHDFKLAAPDEYPSPGDKWLGEKYLSPSFECKSDRLTVSMNAKTESPISQSQLSALGVSLGEDFSNFAVSAYEYSGELRTNFGDVADPGHVVTDIGTAGAVLPSGLVIIDGRSQALQLSIDPSDVLYTVLYDLVVANDGIYVLGNIGVMGTGSRMFVARFTLDGSLDPNFGVSGWSFFDWPFDESKYEIRAKQLLLLEDERLVVVAEKEYRENPFVNAPAGYSWPPPPDGIEDSIVLQGIGLDGVPDPGFGIEGVVETTGFDVGLVNLARPDGVIVDNQIVVAATGNPEELKIYRWPVVIRYNSDGTPDDTFGVGGISVPDSSPSFATEQESGQTVVTGEQIAQIDGQLYLLSKQRTNTSDPGVSPIVWEFSWRVHRLLPSGEIDPGFFGPSGITVDVSTSEIPRRLVGSWGEPASAVLFGGVGEGNPELIGALPFPLPGVLLSESAVQIDNDSADLLFVPRWSLPVKHPDGFLIKRFGDLGLEIRLLKSDWSFDNGYFENVGLEVGNGYTYEVEALPDGSAIARFDHGGSHSNFENGLLKTVGGLLRLLPDGHLDPTFGPPTPDNGFLSSDKASDVVFYNGLVVLGDTAQEVEGESQRDWVLTKYNLDGSIDDEFGNSFGDTGLTFTKLGNNAEARALAHSSSDGAIYAAGTVDRKIALVKYNQDGVQSEAGDWAGGITTRIAGRPSAANAVALDSNDYPIVAGYVELGNRRYPALQTYTSSQGYPWNPFGNKGTVITKVGKSAEINDLIVLPNGDIVAVGYVETPSGSDILLMRYEPYGDLDKSFGKAGKVITDLGTDGDRGNAVTLDRRGRIVVSGVQGGPDNDFVTLRYMPDGTLDQSFGTKGVVATDMGSRAEQATDVKIDLNRRIVVSGTTGKDNDAVFAVARYRSDGSPDSQFDDDGRVTTNVGSGADHANGLVLVKNRLPVVVGSSIGAEWKDLFNDYNVSAEGYSTLWYKEGTVEITEALPIAAGENAVDVMYDTEKQKAVFLHVIRDEDTAEFVGAVQTTMYVEFDGPPSNRTCAVSMNFASTYKQPWK